MLPILYGSQTGNGVFLAKSLQKILKSSFYLPIDSFDLTQINNFPLVIFICSTHGDGQCPFNMVKFYNFIMSQNIKIFKFKSAVLGLGDSSYPKYNYCARILIEKLKILGSEVVITEFSNSQDQSGMYDGFNRFQNRLIEYSNLIKENQNDKVNTIQDSPITFSNSIEENKLEDVSIYSDINKEFISSVTVNPFLCTATIISNELVTPEDYDDKVYELILSIPEYKSFKPGDCISILPQNTINLKKIFNFTDQQINFLQREIDFYSTVHQPTFKVLANYTQSISHKNKLIEISNDYDLYHTYIIVPRRNILEVIQDFNLDIPFEFLEDYNKIQPRYFSFSMINDNCHVLYNLIEYSTYLKSKRLGLCSHYMKILKPMESIKIGIVKSNLYLKDKNLLFFATGTGLTLPRSVVHFFKDKRIVIFYGFRYYDKDQLCKDEFNNVEIHYASSRNDRKYIMDAYREYPVENIDDWLVFVSGNTRLNKEIKKLLKEIHNKDVVFQSETW